MLSSILFSFGQFTPKITAIAAMAEILFSAFDYSTTKRYKEQCMLNDGLIFKVVLDSEDPESFECRHV